jgi:hypothetical protein
MFSWYFYRCQINCLALLFVSIASCIINISGDHVAVITDCDARLTTTALEERLRAEKGFLVTGTISKHGCTYIATGLYDDDIDNNTDDRKRNSDPNAPLGIHDNVEVRAMVATVSSRVIVRNLTNVGSAATNSGGGASLLHRHLDALTLPDNDNVFQKPVILPSTGQSVVYIIDSGVRPSHQEFLDTNGTSRMQVIYRYNPSLADDCFFHGVHVAALAGGNSVGVSPFSKLFFAQVLDCAGRGNLATVLAGLYSVLDHCTAAAFKNVVINLSLGADYQSESTAAAFSNVFNVLRRQCNSVIVAAAGNDATDACFSIPAALTAADAGRVVSVAAANTRTRTFAEFSNYGMCTTLIAPGVQVLSASNAGNNAYVEASGTSMAAPIVAGILAELMRLQPANWHTTAALVNRFDSSALLYGEVILQTLLKTASYEYVRSIPQPQKTTQAFAQLTLQSSDYITVTKPPANNNYDTIQVLPNPGGAANQASSLSRGVASVTSAMIVMALFM